MPRSPCDQSENKSPDMNEILANLIYNEYKPKENVPLFHDNRHLSAKYNYKPIQMPVMPYHSMILCKNVIIKSNPMNSVHNIHEKVYSALQNINSQLPWEFIRVVVVKETSDNFICSICLERLKAPRVTACGHLLCLTCFLYLHPDKEEHKVCPVCCQYITLNSLRPAILQPILESIKNEQNFVLVYQQNAQTIRVPGRIENQDVLEKGIVADHVYIPLYGTPSAVFSKYSMEIDELLHTIEVQDNTGIDIVLNELQIEESEIQAQINENQNCNNVYLECNRSYQKKCFSAIEMVQQWKESCVASLSLESPVYLTLSSLSDVCSDKFAFYQLEDGSFHFIDALSMRMLQEDALLAHRKLHGKVQLYIKHIESSLMPWGVKEKYKMPIPIGSNYSVCYPELTRIVSSNITNKFAANLTRKESKRLAHQKREDRIHQCINKRLKKKEIPTLYLAETSENKPASIDSLPSLEEVKLSIELDEDLISAPNTNVQPLESKLKPSKTQKMPNNNNKCKNRLKKPEKISLIEWQAKH